MTEKQMHILSVTATLAGVGMYVSYIPQIQNNLAGAPGIILGLITFITSF